MANNFLLFFLSQLIQVLIMFGCKIYKVVFFFLDNITIYKVYLFCKKKNSPAIPL